MILDLDVPVHPQHPQGWQTDRDFIEVFLIVAALEAQKRLQIAPLDPFGPGVFERLPPAFRYDTFAGLLAQNERIGRVPLLQLVWLFAGVKIDYFRGLGFTPSNDFQRALSRMEGTALGAHGTSLFLAAFERMWFFGEESDLTPTEAAYLAGDPIFGASGRGVLVANGTMFLESIWMTAFRLIEHRGAEPIIDSYRDRVNPVLDILKRGAERAPTVVLKYEMWPGWAES